MILKLLIALKRLFKEKSLIHNPDSLIIDTTIFCNNCCSFCWRKNKPEYLEEINKKYMSQHTMPFKTYKKIIDDCTQYKSIRWLSLCGPMGEPLLNKELEKFTTYAYNKKHFDTIVINTNGLAIDKHDIKALLNSINEFSISVDSIREETYKKIHGHSNLQKVIDNIKSLVEYKRKNGAVANIFVRFTENKLNRGEFPEFKEFFEKIGVDYINYTQEHAFAGVNKTLAKEHSRNLCNQPHNVVNFNFLGEMTTCCINWQLSPTFDSISNQTVKEMWESDKKLEWNNSREIKQPCIDCGGLGFDAQHSQKIKITKIK